MTIFKLNIDENPDAPRTYGVRDVPTLIVFKGDCFAPMKPDGAEPKRQIKERIEWMLA